MKLRNHTQFIKNIFSLTTTLILSSCSYLPFSGIKNYKIEKMANIFLVFIKNQAHKKDNLVVY